MPIITDDTDRSGFVFKMEIIGAKAGKPGLPTGCIHQTYWRLTGTLENCPHCGESHEAYFEGATPLRPPEVDTNGDGFIDINDVTEEMVIIWVEEMLNGDLHPFERIIKEIDQLHEFEMGADATKFDLPWVSSET